MVSAHSMNEGWGWSELLFTYRNSARTSWVFIPLFTSQRDLTCDIRS